jgi:DNA-binding beta-propeller fold protein YncE
MTQLQERPVHVMPSDDDRPAQAIASPALANIDASHWRREYVRTPVPPPRGTNRMTRTFRAHPQLVKTVLSTVTVTAAVGLLVGAALTFLPGHPWAAADSSNGTSASAVVAGDRPAGVAISADARQVYVAASGSSKLLVLKADDLSLIQSVPVPGLHPSAIAVDAAHHTAFLVDSHSRRVAAVDLTSGTVAAEFKTGDAPAAVAVDPVRQRLYVANSADKTVWAYDISNGRRVGTLKTSGKPTSLALNTTTKRLYVLAGGKISSFHSSSLKAAGKARSAAGGSTITVDSGNRYLYLAGPGTLKRWELSSGQSSSMAITGNPAAISASTPAATAFVAVPDEDRLTRVAIR